MAWCVDRSCASGRFCTAQFRAAPRRIVRIQVTQASFCPYRALGVSDVAGEKEIKKAYRKLALKYHPDVSQAPDAERAFLEIQAAYEFLTGKARGKEVDNLPQGQGNWDFHDWYWQFRINRTRDSQARKHRDSQTTQADSTPKPQNWEDVRSQLAGLRHRAAIRKVKLNNAESSRQDDCSESTPDGCVQPAAPHYDTSSQQQPYLVPDSTTDHCAAGHTDSATAPDVADGANYEPEGQAAAGDSHQRPKFAAGSEARQAVTKQLAGLRRKSRIKSEMM